MKLPIEHHAKGIANLGVYLESEERHLSDLRARVASLREDLAFAIEQLRVARERGLTEYDAERFLKPRKRGRAR